MGEGISDILTPRLSVDASMFLHMLVAGSISTKDGLFVAEALLGLEANDG